MRPAAEMHIEYEPYITEPGRNRANPAMSNASKTG
jgi:hypothetical protein